MRTETRTRRAGWRRSERQTWTEDVILLKPEELHYLEMILRSHSHPDDHVQSISVHGNRGSAYSIRVKMEGEDGQ